MNILDPEVKFSSIVDIGEEVQKLESNGDIYLKLHRGVMNVTSIDLSFIDLDLNFKSSHQYSGNDGDSKLIKSISSYYKLESHKIVICPGGMSGIDIVVSSLSDKVFWVPEYHWGSWNKILKIYNKEIKTFDEFDLDGFRPESGVVMMCYPSNPTGWMPSLDKLKSFILYCRDHDVTVILDLPYYHLFFDSSLISDLFLDNVIFLSSFSKSIGLSGYRIGYVATLNPDLYRVVRVRSLYKYNSISNLPQIIINEILSTDSGKISMKKYQNETVVEIKKNIDFLEKNDILWDKYPNTPIGPFCIININFNDLISYKISSVPLSKFTINGSETDLSRISVSVPHLEFVHYFKNILRVR
jgi:aspartate/methionine/tyrosine aminotransferase